MHVFTGDEVIATDLPAKLNENFAKTENGITNLENRVIPIEKGGTGATSVSGARNALGLGNTSGALPIANGGTGATTASDACANIGALPTTGGTMSGNLHMSNLAGILMDVSTLGLHMVGGRIANSGPASLETGFDPCIWLMGKNFDTDETWSGTISLQAINDTNHATLLLKPSGILKFKGQNIVRSVNGINADNTGNVIVNPAGTIYAFAGNDIPTGYLPCNGSVISRTTYADLFAVIGTTYGSGDGSTTFNLPDLTDRFLEGSSTAGNYISAGLPNIKGVLVSPSNDGWKVLQDNTLFYSGTSDYDYRTHLESQPNGMSGAQYFDASRYNPIYGNSDTVQPSALTMRYIIKY